MTETFESRYRAVRSRDARFDGWFFTAVTSTGIYCRPSCPAVTPRKGNVRFYPTAAAAQYAGFRACKRCRPDAVPGSPEWNARADLAGRAMRLVADGVVDREGVAGLARRLSYTERHLHRTLVAEVGAGPLALARARRAHTARLLIETTTVPISEVAFAAGFASIRQLNDTVREVFAATPKELRRARGRGGDAAPGTIPLRLPYRTPFDAPGLLSFLEKRAVSGVEEVSEGSYRRTLRLPHGTGVVELSDGGDHVRCLLRLEDLRDLGAAVQRCRRLLDLDADPLAVDEALGADPLLRPLVRRTPELRVPGSVDGAELAVRAVLGQGVSVAGARTLAGRLVARFGRQLPGSLADPDAGPSRLFPEPADLADAAAEDLPMPAARREALRGLARALAAGDLVLDPGADRGETERELLALRGVGPWTASYVAMRALGDPDAFLPTDPGGAARGLRARAPGRPRERRGPRRTMAPLALLRRAAPVGQPGREEEQATERGDGMNAYVDTVDSPAGQLAFAVDDDGALVRLHFVESDFGAVMERELEDEGYAVVSDGSRTARVREELSEYAAGRRTTFDAPLALVGSEWQRAVWQELTRIPFGETRSYGEIADRLGKPGAARAVGRANATNLLPVLVPCHRVVAADGTLGGFNGGLHLKTRLLDHERRVLARHEDGS